MKYIKNTILALMLLFTALGAAAQQAAPPFFLQKNWYNRQMADVFEYLSKKKLDKAEAQRLNIVEKFEKDKEGVVGSFDDVDDLLHPVWQLSYCVLQNTREGRLGLKKPLSVGYDPWSAYTLLKTVVNDTHTVVLANTFFIEKKLPFTVESIKRDIEKNLVDTVRAAANEKDYDRLIDILFSYVDIATLKTEREQVAYRDVIVTESVAECERFMEKYNGMNTFHYSMVTMRRDSLAYVQMDTTVAACKNYLSSYPQSTYVDEVTKQLHHYAFNQLAHSSAACQDYLDQYPTSKYIPRVKELKVSYAFEETKRNGTIGAYRRFLSNYGSSDYSEGQGFTAEARSLLKTALLKKFLGRNATIGSLKQIVARKSEVGVDIPEIERYYHNLLYQPTSAFMNGHAGLTGEVVVVTMSSNSESRQTMNYNEQGLLTHEENDRNGSCYSYFYTFEDEHGYVLSSKTDEKNRSVNYTAKYNADGSLLELAASDGSKIRYSYNGNNLDRVTYLQGSATERVDVYGYNNVIEKSERQGQLLVYESNGRGDIVAMSKKRGNSVMAKTTYEYEYSENGRPWTAMTQYNDGRFLLSKTQHYQWREETDNILDDGADVRLLQPAHSTSSRTQQTFNDVFDVVDQMPQFPGGDGAMMEYLSRSIMYPEVAADNGIQGRVVCTFVVERDGSISDVRVTKSIDPSLDKEAIRVLEGMPQWKPGMQNGAPVRVKYTVPVTFRLQ